MYVKALVATAFATTAIPAECQGLDVALAQALESDPRIANADAQVQAARATIDIVRSEQFPEINAGGITGMDRISGPQAGGTRFSTRATADFSLPLYMGGNIKWRIRSARRSLAVRLAERDEVLNAELATTASRYASVYRDQVIHAASIRQVEDVGTILTSIQARADIGDATQVDVQQGVARLALSRARLAMARAALTTSQENLRELTGTYFGEAGDAPVPDIVEPTPEGLRSDVSSSPTMLAAEARVFAAEADVKVARSERLPRLSLSSGAQSGNDLAARDPLLPARFRTAMQIGLTFRVPLFQGGAPAARIRQAQQIAIVEMAERDATEMRLLADIRSKFGQLKAAEQMMTALALSLEANRIALEGVTLEAGIGNRTNLDILNARQEVVQTEIQLAQARQQRLSLAYTILGQLGRLRPPPREPSRSATVIKATPIVMDRKRSAATRLTFNSAGLWVWDGSTTWSLPSQTASRSRA